MKRRNIIIILSSVLILVLPVLVYKTYNIKRISAEEVVRKYYEYKNKKDIYKLNKTLIPSSRNYNPKHWAFEDREYIKLINIKEDKTYHLNTSFSTNGIGKYLNPFDVKIFLVKYEVKYKNNKPRPLKSGIHYIYFTVIKQKENSPWLIAEIGV